MPVRVPSWQVSGDWFDVCNCTIPCPCTFAQPPTDGQCLGIQAWHVGVGRYGDVRLDGLNVVVLDSFTGNIWAGDVKIALGIYLDDRADAKQTEALQMIFAGRARGWPGQLAQAIGEIRGIERAQIEFEIADDLSFWSVSVPGRVEARGDALTGPTTPLGRRVTVHNPPGAEVGPGQIATWGIATVNRADGLGFDWESAGARASTFDSTGRDRTNERPHSSVPIPSAQRCVYHGDAGRRRLGGMGVVV